MGGAFVLLSVYGCLEESPIQAKTHGNHSFHSGEIELKTVSLMPQAPSS